MEMILQGGYKGWLDKLRIFFRENGFFYIAGLLLIVGTKQYYSVANAEGLRWILVPVAGLVSLMTGMRFDWVAQAGFVNHAHGVVIAPACAGVNFFIICFASLFFSFLSRWHGSRAKCLWFVLGVVFAYLLTLVANSLRIVLSVLLYKAPIYSGWLTPGRLHELAGLVIFVSLLVLVWLAAGRLIRPSGSAHRCATKSSARRFAGLPVSTLFLLVPFAWYGLIMVVVPLLRGAVARYGFVFLEHALMVVIVCGCAFFITSRAPVWVKKKVDRADQTKQP